MGLGYCVESVSKVITREKSIPRGEQKAKLFNCLSKLVKLLRLDIGRDLGKGLYVLQIYV